MLASSLVLALALAPEPARDEPAAVAELPHWRSAPEAPPEQPAKVKVPSDGSGLISLGSILLGTGGVLGLMSIGLTAANDPMTLTGRQAAAIVTPFGLGSGGALLTIGLVVRRQFRASDAGSIPDAPRTGGGMLFGGVGLMAGGTAFTATAVGALMSFTCNGFDECYQTRPIGAPIQLGSGIAAIAVGSGLLVGGVKRRQGYVHWAAGRVRLVPTFGMNSRSFSIGVAERF